MTKYAAVLVVLLVPFVLAEAQHIPYHTIQVAQDVYGPGETIHLHGTVKTIHGGAVTIQVMAPSGNIIAVGQVLPDTRDYTWSMPAEFNTSGVYTVQAQYALTSNIKHYATDIFTFVAVESGVVQVNGTDYTIQYTGDVILDAYTDAYDSLLYLTFDGPGSGVMFIPQGLVQGELLAVQGGQVTHVEGGQYAYIVDSDELVLTADAVAIPEFGLAMVVLGVAAAGLLSSRMRLVR